MADVHLNTASPSDPPTWRRLRGTSSVSLLNQVILFAVVVVLLGFGVADGTGADLLGVLTVAACYGLLAIGTNMLLGWSGMMTFCQAAFFGTGAYTVAAFRGSNLPTEVGLLIAAGVAGAAGYLIYFFVSRYTHIAFAMLTLVIGEFIFLFVSGDTQLGDTNGLFGILREPIFGAQTESGRQFWWLAYIILALAFCLYWWLYRRVFALRAFAGREDRGRLETLGYSVRQLHAITGGVSAMICAVGGALYVSYTGAISPTVFQFELSGAAVFMCVIGGNRFLLGPVVGAVLYTLLDNFWLQYSLYAELYIGAIFVIVMLVIPNGVLSVLSVAKSVYWWFRKRGRGAVVDRVPNSEVR